MLRKLLFVLLYLWLIASSYALASKTVKGSPSPWPAQVLNMVMSDLVGPKKTLETSIKDLPEFPTYSWMNELPQIEESGYLTAYLIKKDPTWRIEKEDNFKHASYTTINKKTKILFTGDPTKHYLELKVKEHRVAVLNLIYRSSSGYTPLEATDIVYHANSPHNELTKKVGKLIDKLDSLIQKLPNSKFSLWHPYSGATRLYIDSEGYTHITYYQITTGMLKPLVSAVYSEGHKLAVKLLFYANSPIAKRLEKKRQIIAVIDKAPASSNQSREEQTTNDAGWIKEHSPRYKQYKYETLSPEFTTTEDILTTVIPETPTELMVQDRSPSPNSFSLHLSQGSDSLSDSTEAVWSWVPKTNTEHEGAAEIITTILYSDPDFQHSSQDSEQQTSIELSPIPSSPDQPTITPPAKPHPEASKGKSKKRIRRKRSAFSPPIVSPPRESLRALDSSQNSSSSQSSLLLENEAIPSKAALEPSKDTPDGLENESSIESIQHHQPDYW